MPGGRPTASKTVAGWAWASCRCAEIIAALKAGGYDGYYDVELLGEEIETDDYGSLLQHAKEAFRNLVGSG